MIKTRTDKFFELLTDAHIRGLVSMETMMGYVLDEELQKLITESLTSVQSCQGCISGMYGFCSCTPPTSNNAIPNMSGSSGSIAYCGYDVNGVFFENTIVGAAAKDNTVPSLLSDCGECKGTGRYVGLTKNEDCRKCGGKGKV